MTFNMIFDEILRKVGIFSVEHSGYPAAPFNPDQPYPEFAAMDYSEIDPLSKNSVYAAVRGLFYSLGLDKDNFGGSDWNPLGNFVEPGNTVVIKPNLVIDRHPLGNPGIEAMVTHGSVIRPIVDYVLLAAKGNCEIKICDVPLQSAVWENLIQVSGLSELVDFYKNKNVKIDLLDLRYEISIANSEGVYCKRIKRKRDPLGYCPVDLGEKSYIEDVIFDSRKLEITDYGLGTVSEHHNEEKNEYLIPNSILKSDFFINVPKLKSHRKAGVTLSMKNLIGINGDKSWIAHHRKGVDEYPEFKLWPYCKWYAAHYLKVYAPKFLVTLAYKLHRWIFLGGKSLKQHGMTHGAVLMEGNWHGNDTVWRTILDLNNIIFFTDKKGILHSSQQRKYLTIIDGIVGMEKEGPMEGLPKDSKVLLGGFHPVAVDAVAAHIMGFDWKKIHKIREGFDEKHFLLTPFKFEDLVVQGNIAWKKINLKFAPTKGWMGHIERNN